MKIFTKRTAVVLVAVIATQMIIAVTIASVTLAKSETVQTKIVRLKQKIKVSSARVELYKDKKKQFLGKMAKIRTLIGLMPKGKLKNVLQRNYNHLKQRVEGCNQRVEMYKGKTKKLKNSIKRFKVLASAKIVVGKASWYGGGPREHAMTAAMRGFRGRKVRVTNLSNGRSVVVLVNDYGPAKWTGRVIDLSKASFARLGSLGSGVLGKVKLEIY